jgi:Tol biopolymer transport system component
VRKKAALAEKQRREKMITRTNLLKISLVAAAAILAISLLVLVAAEKRATAEMPAKAASNGLIAFTSDRDLNPDGTINDEIYKMNSDGSKPTRLTNNLAIDQFPAVSPKGDKIAFLSDRSGDWEIWVMGTKDEDDDGNGDPLTQITNSASITWEFLYAISWSPNGEELAFMNTPDGNNREIYKMNKDGSGQTNLTNDPAFDAGPDFSPVLPDGTTKIAFTSNRTDPDDGTTDNEIYVMNADGTNVTQLTHNTASDSMPEFSPDGREIAFQSTRDGNLEIYKMNADGSDQVRLTYRSTFTDRNATWSPDGTQIAFWSGTGVAFADGEIWVMNAKDTNNDGNGDNQTNITNKPNSGDIEPDWGPVPKK